MKENSILHMVSAHILQIQYMHEENTTALWIFQGPNKLKVQKQKHNKMCNPQKNKRVHERNYRM